MSVLEISNSGPLKYQRKYGKKFAATLNRGNVCSLKFITVLCLVDQIQVLKPIQFVDKDQMYDHT